MESEAVATLNHAAFKVLSVLALQYSGHNNGTMALTEVFARRFGFSGRDTLYRSLRELERRGLIVCTRRGIKSKKMFTLYALGWEAITHRDGEPLDVPEPRNNSRWLNWKPSVPMAGNDPTGDCIEVHTDGRESSIPMAGNDRALSVPMVSGKTPDSIPAIGNTSRVSGGTVLGASRGLGRGLSVARPAVPGG